MHIEIVTHCYQYPTLLRYQLSSLVLFPPAEIDITATVLYTLADSRTSSVLDWFQNQKMPRVRWNWQELPLQKVCKRSIGRNMAALASEADWVWFTDADHWFTTDCWATFGKVPEVNAPLLFPKVVHKHRTHLLGDRCIERAASSDGLVAADPAEFEPITMNRAIGGIQIVRGDICRSVGYLRDSEQAQQPVKDGIWLSTREDWVFRRRLGSRGKAIDLPGVYRIRHSRAGRHTPGLML